MTYRQTADFLLHDWLDVESLQQPPRSPTIRARPSRR